MKIATIGSGVVGTATGKGMLAIGHDVVFYDINPMVISKLRAAGHKACNIEQCVTDREVFLMSVSTPTVDGKIELRFLQSAAASLGRVLGEKKDYSLVVVRSTVPPGTTREMIIPILEEYSGKVAGQDFGVCMNPEFLREASSEDDFLKPWIIVFGALDSRSARMMEEVYGPMTAPKISLSLEEAEMVKYVHNLMNANKISFFNEMRGVAESMGIDADRVFGVVAKSAEASWNASYGIKNLGPFGGSCLPKDTKAFLSWAQSRLRKEMLLLEAVIRVNDQRMK